MAPHLCVSNVTYSDRSKPKCLDTELWRHPMYDEMSLPDVTDRTDVGPVTGAGTL